jgi:hypothetical protein
MLRNLVKAFTLDEVAYGGAPLCLATAGQEVFSALSELAELRRGQPTLSVLVRFSHMIKQHQCRCATVPIVEFREEGSVSADRLVVHRALP